MLLDAVSILSENTSSCKELVNNANSKSKDNKQLQMAC